MSVGPTRQDTFLVNVRVQDITSGSTTLRDCGTWDKKSGGEVDSEEMRYKPGGMEPAISLGGSKNVGNVIVSRLYRLQRDHQELVPMLLAGAGKAKMQVSQLPLDIEGNAFGRPIVHVGTLKRVTLPEHDSESSDAAMIELEMTVSGEPAVA